MNYQLFNNQNLSEFNLAKLFKIIKIILLVSFFNFYYFFVVTNTYDIHTRSANKLKSA